MPPPESNLFLTLGPLIPSHILSYFKHQPLFFSTKSMTSSVLKTIFAGHLYPFQTQQCQRWKHDKNRLKTPIGCAHVYIRSKHHGMKKHNSWKWINSHLYRPQDNQSSRVTDEEICTLRNQRVKCRHEATFRQLGHNHKHVNRGSLDMIKRHKRQALHRHYLENTITMKHIHYFSALPDFSGFSAFSVLPPPDLFGSRTEWMFGSTPP